MASDREIYTDDNGRLSKKIRYWKSTENTHHLPAGYAYRSRFDQSQRGHVEITYQEYRALEDARKARTGHTYNVFLNGELNGKLLAEAKRLDVKPQDLLQAIARVYLDKK